MNVLLGSIVEVEFLSNSELLEFAEIICSCTVMEYKLFLALSRKLNWKTSSNISAEISWTTLKVAATKIIIMQGSGYIAVLNFIVTYGIIPVDNTLIVFV